MTPFTEEVELRYDDQIMVLVTREEAHTIVHDTLSWARTLLSAA